MQYPIKNLLQDMQNFCSSLFSTTGITYVDYYRHYHTSNEFIGISTDYNWINYCEKKQYPFCTSFINTGIHLWEAFYPDRIIFDARQMFNYAHFISIFKRNNDYIEVFDFATTPYNKKILSLYTNKMDILEKFCSAFTEDFATQHAQIKTAKLNSSNLLIAANKSTNLLADNINILNKHNLSLREKDCVKHLILGMSAKEVANQLNLSSRTIEFYINNIKTKLGCTKKSDIIKFYIRKYGMEGLDRLI